MALEIEGEVVEAEPGKIPSTTIYTIKLEEGQAKMDLPDTLIKMEPGQHIMIHLLEGMDEKIVEESVFCAKARTVESMGDRMIISISGFIGVFENNKIKEFFSNRDEAYFCLVF